MPASSTHRPVPFQGRSEAGLAARGRFAEREPVAPPDARQLPSLTPADTEFVVLSFEGPDPYCRAGGLGVRVTGLTRALAERGFETHFLFLGDPDAAAHEQIGGLPLYYHRWGQWLGRFHRSGVYDGEEAKVADFHASVPAAIVQQCVRPAMARGRRVVVLSEEWHTASTACEISDALWRAGLRDRALMVWNANNTMGFERIDFPRLAFTQTLSTVSHWMKHEMWKWGCNPVVVPNGIPGGWLAPSRLADMLAERAQAALRDRLTLGKVARFDPDKRWFMAVDAAARLKRQGFPVLFVARGGVEPHGVEVLERARAAGLRVRDVECGSSDPHQCLAALLDAARDADMLNLRFHLCEPLARALYRVADAMLQHSGREPFGLVGLEVMAASGLVFTGATGEEYARSDENAVVLETEDPRELEAILMDLINRPEAAAAMRKRAVETARGYTWDRVLDHLLRRLQLLAMASP